MALIVAIYWYLICTEVALSIVIKSVLVNTGKYNTRQNLSVIFSICQIFLPTVPRGGTVGLQMVFSFPPSSSHHHQTLIHYVKLNIKTHFCLLQLGKCPIIGYTKHLPVFLLGTENVMGWWMTSQISKKKGEKKREKK